MNTRNGHMKAIFNSIREANLMCDWYSNSELKQF